MTNPGAIEKARQGKRNVTERLYDRFVVNEAFTASDGDLADRFKMPKQDVRNARNDLAAVGSLTHVRAAASGHGKIGWTNTWTLVDPKGTALAKLEHRWRDDDKRTADLMSKSNPAKGVHKNRPMNGHLNGATVAHPVLPDVLVASSGPQSVKPLAALASERYDEPRAMIEAARQYATTQKELDAKVKEMEALTGKTVDRVALGKLFQVHHDHALLIVSKVMPYVEGLERQLARAQDSNADLRTKIEEMPGLRDQARRLSDSNQRLIAERTALQNQLNNRTEVAPRRESAPNAPAPDA